MKSSFLLSGFNGDDFIPFSYEVTFHIYKKDKEHIYEIIEGIKGHFIENNCEEKYWIV